MTLKSISNFEARWNKLRKLASAQLKDLEKDRKAIAKQIKAYKVKKDVGRLRTAVAQSRSVERAAKATKQFIRTKDKLVKEASRRGKLLKRALT